MNTCPICECDIEKCSCPDIKSKNAVDIATQYNHSNCCFQAALGAAEEVYLQVDQLQKENEKLKKRIKSFKIEFKKPHEEQIIRIKYELAMEFKKHIESVKNENEKLKRDNKLLRDKIGKLEIGKISLVNDHVKKCVDLIDKIATFETDNKLL